MGRESRIIKPVEKNPDSISADDIAAYRDVAEKLQAAEQTFAQAAQLRAEAQGAVKYVSEQFAKRYRLEPGDQIDLDKALIVRKGNEGAS